MKPRAITGVGVLSALGTGADAMFSGLTTPPKTAPEPTAITSFDATAYGRPAVVEVPDFDPTKYLGDKGLRTLDRLTKLLVVAARLSLQHAGLKKDGRWAAGSPERVGVCCSNAYGSLEAITELDRVAVLEDARYINPAKFPNTVSNSASGYVSIWEDLRALNVSVSDGNCGALDALSCADIFLETGRAEAILTGGGEAMSEALFVAFDKLGVLESKRGDGAPNGARLGEGAAFLVVEPMSLAEARGARILASVTGYGTAFVAPKDDTALLFASPLALERAIVQALADAGIAAHDVDLVVAGISGIDRFDDVERKAIANAVGADVAVAAPKLLFGETLGAGGALAMSSALAWLDGTAPAPLVAGSAPARIDTVLVTTVGYYGNASAVVMHRAGRAPNAVRKGAP
ncbi:MAG TPA: beta-ketoacyl synthase N-terminal-like domain-containing protein [Labilithrix sp.]|nr:beta-ketoacyl synthase N-terminal-like domain-containing protein [Labilithrix sp.]